MSESKFPDVHVERLDLSTLNIDQEARALVEKLSEELCTESCARFNMLVHDATGQFEIVSRLPSVRGIARVSVRVFCESARGGGADLRNVERCLVELLAKVSETFDDNQTFESVVANVVQTAAFTAKYNRPIQFTEEQKATYLERNKNASLLTYSFHDISRHSAKVRPISIGHHDPASFPFISRLDTQPRMPNYEAVRSFTESAIAWIFHGFRSRTVSTDMLEGLIDKKLRPEITRALSVASDLGLNVPVDDLAVACEFANSLLDIKQSLNADASHMLDNDPAANCREIIPLVYPGMTAIAIYRLGHRLRSLRLPFIPEMMCLRYAKELTSIEIFPGAVIADRVAIDHGSGVVIGDTAEIAENVMIYQGTTLGAHNFERDDFGNLVRDSKRHPTVLSGVRIYANATILGGDTIIGHGAVIGANTFVTRSVPAYHLAYLTEDGETRVRPF